ncbi:hypothetical protein M5K25_021711 [Dendrobium thyrsiflorum]|uniref:Uncharacterized protein n=1 Tax=Dendrobium thyrsiflorum TaxID=117978 RepID=A0ABD0U5E2_DENTH
MLGKVLDRSFAGHISLKEESEHGEHGEPTVLDLLHFEQSSLVWIIGQAKRIKWTSWVKLVFQILYIHVAIC